MPIRNGQLITHDELGRTLYCKCGRTDTDMPYSADVSKYLVEQASWETACEACMYWPWLRLGERMVPLGPMDLPPIDVEVEAT